MKRVSILGSTGSIGRNSLEVIAHLGYEVVGLAAGKNIDELQRQIERFKPQCVAVADLEQGKALQKRLPHAKILLGDEGLTEVATHPDADFVISAIMGAKGIVPTLSAIEAKKTIGLANKEVLIAAGELIMKRAEACGAHILPIDSEHSAIFQCLQGENPLHVRRLILTASGGPFRNFSMKQLAEVTPESALKHPNWKMGNKITIDCSTFMNKGLEVIEAKFLFNVPLEQIDVVVHPQSVIHSFVEMIDGSLLAQLAEHDMKIPIQYALTYPHRKKGIASCFDFQKYSKLEFSAPDKEKFPCLGLAYEAARVGGTLPCFMNGANEVLVSQFLKGKIGWKEIGKRLEHLMGRHRAVPQMSLETLLAVDREAREMATNC